MSLDRRTRSLDEEGHRKAIHPVEVNGKWNRRRELLQFALIVFFLVLPWLTIGGKPLLLLDIVNRKFSILGVLFRAHDVPIVFLFAVAFILSFGLLTSLFGRVWCGFACPQTVFIEGVFRRIERWIEGTAFERKKRDASPQTVDGVLRKALKWAAFALVSLVITHSFLAIFVGTSQLRQMIQSGPAESPQAFLFIVLSTAVILFDFGWFREQFCIVACPYGRIQSVFQDEATRTVSYDVKRGEPRGKKGTLGSGDCVDCFRCVSVCPTGIDIRNGSSQLECIACTACMDACDEVMTRIQRPKGLIRYEAVQPGSKMIRGRVLAYGFLLIAAVAAIGIVTGTRKLAMVEIFKNKGVLFQTLNPSEGKLELSNLFIAEIENRSSEPIEVEVKLTSGDGDAALLMPNNPIQLKPGDFQRQPITVKFSKAGLDLGKKYQYLEVTTKSAEKTETERKELTLVGPITSL